MRGAGIPHQVRYLVEVRDEMRADNLGAELAAGRWVGYWHDARTDEWGEISQLYWLDRIKSIQTLWSGQFIRPKTTHNPRPRGCTVFVAQRQRPETARGSGGRPRTHDWEGVLIHVAAHIHNNGLPKKQADLVLIMQEWFAGTDTGEPALSELKKRARRIFAEFRAKAGN
jgi:hypothetical protein